MDNVALIQLVSAQTMPNLLPVLRLRPARLIHLVTPKTAERSAHIAEAARRTGQSPVVDTLMLSAMPGIPETYHVVKNAISQAVEHCLKPVVNFTGGTKLMSIGSYAAATEMRAPSLYVDTDDRVFVCGKTGDGIAELLNDEFSFTPLQRSLTVDIVAVANGRKRVTGGRPWQPLLPLARHLLEHPRDEHAMHESLVGRDGWLPANREPKRPDDWLPHLQRSFALPERVAQMAALTNLVEINDDGRCMLPASACEPMRQLAGKQPFKPDFTAAYFSARNVIQNTLTFLTGGWWEVAVMDAAERSGRFRDLRWSVNVGERDGADLEEDIVGLDGVEVLYLSCKRGGQRARLLPLLDEINARALSIGGTFTRRILATYLPPTGFSARTVPQRAKELGIRIITPADLQSGAAFRPFARP